MVMTMHNKFIVSVLVAVLLGSLIGHTLFQKYRQEDMQVFQEDVVYFFEEGVYDNQERAENATTAISTKLIVKEDAKYSVYLAITQDKNNMESLKKMFADETLNVTIKEMAIENSSFLTSLEQMDGLMKQVKTNEERETINRVILANYEEFVLKQ